MAVLWQFMAVHFWRFFNGSSTRGGATTSTILLSHERVMKAHRRAMAAHGGTMAVHGNAMALPSRNSDDTAMNFLGAATAPHSDLKPYQANQSKCQVRVGVRVVAAHGNAVELPQEKQKTCTVAPGGESDTNSCHRAILNTPLRTCLHINAKTRSLPSQCTLPLPRTVTSPRGIIGPR